jgi:hypothetical protein
MNISMDLEFGSPEKTITVEDVNRVCEAILVARW